MEFVVDVEIGSHVGRLLGIVNGVIASAAAAIAADASSLPLSATMIS